MQTLTRRLTTALLIPLLLAGLFFPGSAGRSLAAQAPGGPFTASARQVLAGMAAGQKSGFIITLHDQLAAGGPGAQSASSLSALLSDAAAQPSKPARQKVVIEGLQAHAARQQAGLLAQASLLQAQGQVDGIIPFWIFNGVSLQATPAAIQGLAARPEVARISPDPDPAAILVPLGGGLEAASLERLPSPAGLAKPGSLLQAATAPPEPNVAQVDAPALWDMGYTGQGIVIASLDTGVNAAHPDLAASYRGGSNSWFDPYGQNAAPADFSADQHGTMTMGLMVGGGAGGTSIGMAPGARWISAKIFDNTNKGTSTAIHQAFQWVLNPNNDPANPGAPDVVNNSWGFTSSNCDISFLPDIQALLAAGILPIFSVGNAGPNSPSNISPGNNAGAFSVGSVDNTGAIASFSSRGPNLCDAAAPSPYLVAPGVALHSSSSEALYAPCTGTSCSAPEVSGALALLLSALPHLGVDLQQQALIHGAVDLGAAGYDSTFGFGRLDALSAYTWLTSPLVVPTNLAASGASPNQIDLSWQDHNQANATGYEVDRSPGGQTDWVRLTTTPSGATAFSDSSGLSEGATYSYRVRAVNAGLGTASQYASLQATTQLLAPTGFSAAAAAPAQINLSWQNNTALATGVEIQRSPDGLSGWTTITITTPADTGYTDATGLSEGTLYYYRLRAINAGAASQYTGAQATTLLLAPSGLAAAAAPNQVSLSWVNNSVHASGCEIQRSPDGVGGWITLSITTPGAAAFVDAGLAEANPYFYRVRAVGPGVSSAYASASATTLLLAPSGVAARPVSTGQIDLSWTNNSAFASGVEVQRSPDGLTGWVTLTTSAAAATAFSDSAGLSEGSAYFYRLRAVNPTLGLASQYAGAAAVTPLAALTGFAAVSASGTQINLFWTNASAHAAGIEIQRSPDGLTGWTTLVTAAPTDTNYPDTPLTPGTLYYYRARAVGPASTSAYTPVVHAFPGIYRTYVPGMTHQ